MADLNETIKELKDALAVTNAMQERHAKVLLDHSEWLASHDKAMLEIREAGQQTDARIEKLVLAIGKLIQKQH